jgi:hypothetical protein
MEQHSSALNNIHPRHISPRSQRCGRSAQFFGACWALRIMIARAALQLAVLAALLNGLRAEEAVEMT